MHLPLQHVSPSELPSLFLTSLEPALLVSILDTFKTILTDDKLSEHAQDDILQYLRAFPTVPRFEFVLMFLSTDEQRLVGEVWKVYGHVPGRDVASGWKL